MVDYGLNSPWFPDPVKCFSEILSTGSQEIVNRSCLLAATIDFASTLTALSILQITMERLVHLASRDVEHALHMLLFSPG